MNVYVLLSAVVNPFSHRLGMIALAAFTSGKEKSPIQHPHVRGTASGTGRNVPSARATVEFPSRAFDFVGKAAD